MRGSLSDLIGRKLQVPEASMKNATTEVKNMQKSYTMPPMTFAVVYYRGLVMDAKNAASNEAQHKWKRITEETKKSGAA